MVTLSKIYTRTGDGGETRLTDNSVARKTDLRVEAYGQVDEANSAIGLAVAFGLPERIVEMFDVVRSELFDLGADLATPDDGEPLPYEPLRIVESQVTRLESEIDDLNATLEPLTTDEVGITLNFDASREELTTKAATWLTDID